MISQTYIASLSADFTELASELDLETLEELRKVMNRISNDPDLSFEERIRDFAERRARHWYERVSVWINTSLPAVYMRGYDEQDVELDSLTANPKNEANPIPLARFRRRARLGGDPSDNARRLIPESHWASYSRYEHTFKEDMNRIRLPFRRSAVQNYREIAALKQLPDFQEGNVATRQDMAQTVINEFGQRGINVIDFPSRRKMSVEAFAEREARAYLQHVAVQGQINRAVERGYDLVRINSYAGASPMCAPYQGHVFSISGTSSQYPSLQDAIFDGSYTLGGGLYHDYCGHFQSTYIPGLSESVRLTDSPEERRILEEKGEAEGNKYIYDVRQTQRDIEYQIRLYKRRQAVALTASERERNRKLVKRWQADQRRWIEQHDFLKRNYTRERV